VGNVGTWCFSATDSTCELVCMVSTHGWLARLEKCIHVTQSIMYVAVPNIAECSIRV
jgi:hypothetical protein